MVDLSHSLLEKQHPDSKGDKDPLKKELGDTYKLNSDHH